MDAYEQFMAKLDKALAQGNTARAESAEFRALAAPMVKNLIRFLRTQATTKNDFLALAACLQAGMILALVEACITALQEVGQECTSEDVLQRLVQSIVAECCNPRNLSGAELVVAQIFEKMEARDGNA